MTKDNRVGRVYRCAVCGSELSIIRSGNGRLEPFCCNQKMDLMEKINHVYYCSLCGSEVMLILDRGGKLDLICCNQKMKRRDV